jgi:hypothetical protein
LYNANTFKNSFAHSDTAPPGSLNPIQVDALFASCVKFARFAQELAQIASADEYFLKLEKHISIYPDQLPSSIAEALFDSGKLALDFKVLVAPFPLPPLSIYLFIHFH